ncbi:MAG: hypothetical protein ACKPKO_02200, partial [Candidatus Fonsibacter sp.]
MDDMEAERRMEEFKAEGLAFNSYREHILDDACMEAFGSTIPTKEGVFWTHGSMAARMFAKRTQGRPDFS